MKKSLIALAVLAAAGTASAQSSVTLFGIVDATVQHIKNDGGSSVTRLTNSGYNSSRLGFRGTEDLGGGLSASFWLEAGVNNDDGQGTATNAFNQNVPGFNSSTGANPPVRLGTQGLVFNRRSTVSLAGGWGEVRLGRDYTPQFWNLTVFDPFGTNGIGTTQTLNSIITGATSIRASNSVGYWLPGNLGGFYGQYMHYFGENPSGVANDGTGDGFRLGWANGPINVALAMSQTNNHTALVNGADSKIKQNNVGAQWDFGILQLMGHYSWDTGPVGPGSAHEDAEGWLLGGLFPIGAGQIRLAYSEYKVKLPGVTPKAAKWALGYVHNLSKRTALYITYADVTNKNGSAQTVNSGAGNPTANSSSSGWDLGIRHSF
jgi:predicted porin